MIVKVHQTSGLVSPYFQLTAAPAGTIRAGSLELVNPTAHTVTARLDPVDAITTNTLGSAYAQPNAGIHGSTTWLRLSRQKVAIPPHGSQSVSVSLEVPASAGPGDYLSGVAVEALGQSQTTHLSKGLAIGEIDRYAIGVEVTLPGVRRPALSFAGATLAREPAGLSFLLAASNTGNVILKNVHGWVRVTTGARRVAAATIQPGTFVSGTGITYPVRALREQPAPGTSYRVRGVLYYQGGVARLDTTVAFSHAAAVTQQNYGGRKLPQSTPPWGWLILGPLAAAALAGVRLLVVRRRRPLARAAGLRLLERSLEPEGERPVSILLVKGGSRYARAIAATIKPRLRRSDRICELSPRELLVICPRTSRPVATDLQRDLCELLARHPTLADAPIEVARATAVKPTTASKLLGRVAIAQQRQRQELVGPRHAEPATRR